ncbi:DNA repair protein RadC [Pseudomonas sediminis]|uniref:RadC family protein n=1 Tax=Pseudomonas sediminis TaxID=1691904 RepID=UPI002448FD67|nr:DNA repair protein RadC [Pseudomonas sediminis]MDG9760862.1 DNA repair protein RadC [Pseudomonas sediminis]
MSIRDWPAAERPREKLLERGAASLTDAELLAIFLRTGVTGKSAVDLARYLLSEFGSLRALLEADLAGFSQHLGLGPAKYAQLQAVLEMSRRHLAERLRRDSALESPQAVRDYLKAQLRHEPHEVFGCLFLDAKHRVLAFEVLFRGSIDSASVYPRQVVKRALANNAAAVILTHNHPSGVSEPSQADRVLTQRLKDALALVEVRVLDHFIVGDGEPLSMAELGWM